MANNDKIVNKYAFLTTAIQGINELVPAYPNGKIVVLSVVLISQLVNSIGFRSSTNDISATYNIGANGGVVLPFNSNGWMETLEGEALGIDLGLPGGEVGVTINYTIR